MIFTAPSPDSSSLAAASQWIAELLQGGLATAIAIVAVAILGYQMISGRVTPKAALQVMLGCFVLFGSAAIARDLMHGAGNAGFASKTTEPDDFEVVRAAKPLAIPSPPPQPSGADPFDPYAGTNP